MLNRPWARLLSLAAAFSLSAVLMLYPYALGTRMTATTHTALPLLLTGVSAAFVHGFGFRLDAGWQRIVFSPLVAWPLIVMGLFLLALS